MNKIVIIALGICAAAFVSSCKSSESMYKKAYDKAQAQTSEQTQTPPEQTTVAPTTVTAPIVTTAPVQTTTTVPTENINVGVRNEAVTLISGTGIKTYSVVCGSFGLRANADALQKTLMGKGYNAQIAQQSAGKRLFRVIAVTSDSKSEVVTKLSTLRRIYADAWVLCPRDY